MAGLARDVQRRLPAGVAQPGIGAARQRQNEIPRVTGQHFDYIVKQLMDFKSQKRTNDAGNMVSVSRTLNATDIENLAHYLVGL